MSASYASDTTDFRFLEARPGITMVLLADKPFYRILAVSNDFVITSGRTREEVICKSHFEIFPENPNDPASSGIYSLQNSFDYILQHRTTHSLPLVRYDIPDGNGGFIEKYWKITNAPVFNEEGAVEYIIHTSEDVTVQVKAEQTGEALQELQLAYKKVQESEAKYSSLFNSMDQGFCILEMIFDEQQRPINHVLLETNPVFEKQTGLKEAKGKTAKDLIPDIESHWFERYGAVALTGQPTRFTEYSEAMGRWFDTYAFKVGDSDSRKVALLFTDITDKKKAEEVIMQSEQRFRNMVEQAPVAISVNRGENLVFDVVNEKMLQIIGKSKEVVGKPFLEVMPEMEEQPITQVLNNVIRTGEPVYGNEQLVPIKKGDKWEERYFNFAYTPLIEEGKVVGIMDVATEVTEQVKTRKKVEENSQELQLAVDIADLGTFRLDLLTNQAINSEKINEWFGHELQGYSREDGFNPIHPEDRERVDNVILQTLHSEAVSRHDVTYRVINPHTGVLRHLRSMGKALFNEQGKPYLIVGIIQDITQQVLHQRQLEENEIELQKRVQERTQELEMRNRELEQFTYVSHHDLQEPLRKIVMFTDMIKGEAAQKLSEASQTRLQKVSDAATRMSTALRDVLDFASLSKVEQFVAVDLDEVLAGVQSDLELAISEKRATITSDALPIIKGVPSQMHQLLYNLINNALKFSKPEESPTISITCTKLIGSEMSENLQLDPQKSYYFITVQDNGIGFSPSHADKIFDMFQRLHSRDAFSGTGIGLALVKKVVLNHGGKIWAEGKEGIGATFKTLLPAD